MNFFGLEREFWWAHLLSFRLHDTLLNCYINGDTSGLFLTRTPSTEEDRNRLENEYKGDVIEWLRGTGNEDDANTVIERTVVHGILPDMCQFIFESLECAAKGKLGVALALLRKPCRDHLFALEWILSERDSFVKAFESGPEKIDICKLLTNKREWMKGISQKACDTSLHKYMSDFQTYWDLRFEKSVEWSLEGPWNQAIHLVTTKDNYKTPTGGLNHAFMDEYDRHKILRHYYDTVPLLLSHAVGVLRAIINRWDSKFQTVGRLFDFGVLANLSLYQNKSGNAIRDLANEITEFLREIEWKCDSCGKDMRLCHREDLEHFVADLIVPCHECGHMDRSLLEFDQFPIDGESENTESDICDLRLE